MKNKSLPFLFVISSLFLLVIFSASTCHQNSSETAYKPLFMKRAELESSIKFEGPAELNNPAKIYYKDNIIFIRESYKGIHMVDNTNPKAPVKIGFISVVGCLDLAIKGTTLYVDNATDLVAIDASDATKPFVVKRIVDAFPEPFPPDQLSIPSQYIKENRAPDLVLVSWFKK
ncbi:MAG: hypothetical protein H7296_01710 [Bacteroidia bacterium]|nr:hypothetical protein [Bacteroidia bacterium]